MGAGGSAAVKVRKLSESGDVDGLKKLLAKAKGAVSSDLIDGPDPSTGATGLILAVKNGKIECIRLLLENGANPNMTDADGESALTYAAAAGNTAALGVIATTKPPVEINQSPLPLIAAVQNNQLEAVNFLLEKGANPSALNENEESALIHAVVKGRVAIVKRLIQAKVDLNAGALTHAKTPLIAACSSLYQNEEIFLLLLDAGADPNYASKDGWTALHQAVNDASVALVGTLMEKGANPKSADKNGKTPIDVANDIYDEKNIIHAQLSGEQTHMKAEAEVWKKINQQ